MKKLIASSLFCLAAVLHAATVTSPLTATATVGTAFSYQITLSATPSPGYSFSNVPAGLSGNTVTGIISGAPTTAGTYSILVGANVNGTFTSATLVLTVNAAGGTTPPVVVPPSTPSLFCATDPNPACGVVLTWAAPAASTTPALAVTGYLVFRSVGSGTATQLTASPITVTTYTDSTVASSTTYEYYVVSVDAAGTQSAPSNSAQVIVAAGPSIPKPATPVSLTVSVVN